MNNSTWHETDSNMKLTQSTATPPNYRKQTDKPELKATRHEKTSELQSYIDIYTRAIYTRIDIIK